MSDKKKKSERPLLPRINPRSGNRKIVHWLLVSLLTGLGISLYWWLCFRSVVTTDDRSGISEYHLSWCRCHGVTYDWNRDGLADFVGRLGSTFRWVSTHEPLLSHQESSRCDGVLDVQVNYDSTGKLQDLSADLDRDGVSEHVAEGKAGERLLEDIRSSSCYPR